MKKHLYFALILTLTACTAQTSTIPAPTKPTVVIAESPSPTESLIVLTETLAPTATPEATATPEVGEFIPANNIEFVEGLPNYDLALAPDTDEKAIYLDAIHNQVAWATSKSKGFEGNRAIYEAIIVEHPEWDGIGLGSDYNTVVAFMTEFLTRSGGKMIVADASFNKYTADFNLPVKFEVIEVDKLPQGYLGYLMGTGDSANSIVGGGGSMGIDENGSLTYRIAIVPSALERTQTDPGYIYKSWRWTPGEVVSDMFRKLISETTYKDRDSDKLRYKLYINGGSPKSDGFYRDKKWTFIK